MIVCKFGGSSVATADQIRKVKAIVESDPARTLLVVSAPGKRKKGDEKVTDLLYQCNDAVRMGCSSREIFSKIEERYYSILEGLKLDKKKFKIVLDDVRQKIDAGYGPDYAASRGEYLNARLIAECFGWKFLDTESVIILKSDGTIDPVTYTNIMEKMEKGCKYVVPGFYGSDIEGRVKTFSRGGSDITGAIFAKACNAEKYENWTDVSGIYEANPLVVSEAKPRKEMTYQEVRELSGIGAGVFHEEAIAPIYHSTIPINVKNTNKPEEEGTMVVPSREGDDLVGLSMKGGFSRIVVRKLMLFKQRGMRHALLTMMQIFGVRPSFSMYGIDSVVWFFDEKLASASVRKTMCERLQNEFVLDSVTIDDGYAIAGVVGQGIATHPEVIAKVTDALKKNGIPMSFLNYGSSDTSMLVGVPEDKSDEVQKVLYKALFK